MSIQGVSSLPGKIWDVIQKARPQSPPQPPPDDPTADKLYDITIHQLVDGLGGAVAGASIETVGNTASCLSSLVRPDSKNSIWRAGKPSERRPWYAR